MWEELHLTGYSFASFLSVGSGCREGAGVGVGVQGQRRWTRLAMSAAATAGWHGAATAALGFELLPAHISKITNEDYKDWA